jgi:hypothetical protein
MDDAIGAGRGEAAAVAGERHRPDVVLMSLQNILGGAVQRAAPDVNREVRIGSGQQATISRESKASDLGRVAVQEN